MSKPTDDWFDDLYESNETTPSSVDDVVVHLAGRKSRRWAPPAAISAIAAAVFVVVLILPEASSPTSSDSAPADWTPVQQARDSDTRAPKEPSVPSSARDRALKPVETPTTLDEPPRRVEAAEARVEEAIVTGSYITRAAMDAPLPQTSAEGPSLQPVEPASPAPAQELRPVSLTPAAKAPPPAQMARLRALADTGVVGAMSCSSIAATGRIDDLDAVVYRCPPGVVVQWDGACDGSIATTDTVEEVGFNDGAIELRMGGAVHRYRCVDGHWESDQDAASPTP